jgi:TonB family protein
MPVGHSLLIGVAFKSTVVLGVAWAIAFLLRTRSAATRHIVWTAAFAALLALPFLSLSLPALKAPLPRTLVSPNLTFQTTAAGRVEEPMAHTVVRGNTETGRNNAPPRPDWTLLTIALWAAGAAILMAQMAAGWIAVQRVRRRASPYPVADLRELTGSLGIRHEVDVLETERGSMPMTFGLIRPAVMLPSDAAQWGGEQRRMVLLHELAHVQRGDLATHLLARTALSLCWWNPLAWMAWREFLRERERAADDLVLSAGARPSDYAAYLLEIARSLQSRQTLGWAAIAVARRSQLEGRLLAILDSRANRGSLGRASVWVAIALAVVSVAPFAALEAQESKGPVPPADVRFASAGKPAPSTESATPVLPTDVTATIAAARMEKNYETLETSAKAAEALRKYGAADALLQAALDIRGAKFGQQSVEYGVGLIKVGDIQRRLGKNGDPEAFYTKALPVLGNRPESATAYMHLGVLAMMKKDFDPAMNDFQQALLADPRQAGSTKMWMALVKQRQQNVEDAESLFRDALAVEDPSSAEAATTMEIYSLLLIEQGRTGEGYAMKDRAVALRRAIGSQPAQVSHGLPAGVYKIGNGVTAPKLETKIEPEYTDEARAAKLQGTVILRVEIDSDGVPRNIAITQGLGLGLDEKAVDATTQWRFKAGTLNGQPVPIMAQIEVNFRLM